MIDNVKFYVNDRERFQENVSKNADVDLKTFLSTFTGEVTEYPKIGKLCNLEVRITEKKAHISGSLHKFINTYLDGEEHNYNDFDLRDVHLVVDEISNALQINPYGTEVTNLEFGFNLEIEEDPQKIIDNRLLMYNFKCHNKDLKFRGKGDYKEYEMTDYSVKIYNKSKQYGQDRHILRVEIKFTRSRVLKRLGVYTLADLKDEEVLFNLFNFLVEQFEKLIILDEFYDRADIPNRDVTSLVRYTNPNYWKSAAETKQSYVRERLIRHCRSLIKKYKLNKTKEMLTHKIKDKFYELMQVAVLSTA